MSGETFNESRDDSPIGIFEIVSRKYSGSVWMKMHGGIRRAALGASASRIVFFLAQIISVPILIGRWGSATYGIWLTASALASYMTYSAVGLAPVLRSELALNVQKGDQNRLRETFQTCVLLVCLSGVASLIALIFALKILPISILFKATNLDADQLRFISEIMGFSVVLALINGLMAAGLSAMGGFAVSQSIDAGKTGIEMLCISLFVGLMGDSPSVAAFIYPITAAGSLVVNLVFLIKRAPWLFGGIHFNLRSIRHLLKPMGGAIMLSLGYTTLSVQAPRIVVAATLGPTAVAVFSLATMLMRMVRIPIEIPAFASTVEISLAIGRKDLPAAQKFIIQATNITMWIALIALPFVIAFGGPAASIWSAGKISIPFGILGILSLATLAYSIGITGQEALMALNKLGQATIWLLVTAPMFVLLCYGLSSVWGIVGTCISVVALEILFAVLATRKMLEEMNINPSHYFLSIIKLPKNTGFRTHGG